MYLRLFLVATFVALFCAAATAETEYDYSVYTVHDEGEVIAHIEGYVGIPMFQSAFHMLNVAKPTKIIFDSAGGEMRPGFGLAALIRQMDPKPEVVIERNDICLSACAFAIMGADQVTIEKGAIVGLHRPWISPESIQDLNEEQRLAVERGTAAMTTFNMVQNGFSFHLISALLLTTDKDKYIVFTSGEQMMKYTGRFNAGSGIPFQYMTAEEITKTIKLRREEDVR